MDVAKKKKRLFVTSEWAGKGMITGERLKSGLSNSSQEDGRMVSSLRRLEEIIGQQAEKRTLGSVLERNPSRLTD